MTRRSQLVNLITQEKNRLKQTWDADAKKSVQKVLDLLGKELKSVDQKLVKMLRSDTKNHRNIEILKLAKGVGDFVATLVAIRCNTKLKAYYVHLKAKGKESKVAIVACARKFITSLNYLIKTDQLWETKGA